MPKILISGAAGFVGGCLMRGLPTDWSLTGVDLRLSDDRRVITGDIGQMDATGLAAEDFDIAIHLAGDPDEIHSLSKLVGPNVVACESFLRWCAAGGIKRLIFASSCEAFLGEPSDQPIAPDSPYRPRNVYGCTKIFGEMLCRVLAADYGCDTVSVRLGAFLPEDMDAQLRGETAYETIRMPEDELIAGMVRLVDGEWSGSRAVFLGPSNSDRLPTAASYDALLSKAMPTE